MRVLPVMICYLALLAGSASGQRKARKVSRIGPWETRCGWFSNPTPANAWLDDRDGEWYIGVQGGHQARGDWPAFKGNQWVEINGITATAARACGCGGITRRMRWWRSKVPDRARFGNVVVTGD